MTIRQHKNADLSSMPKVVEDATACEPLAFGSFLSTRQRARLAEARVTSPPVPADPAPAQPAPVPVESGDSAAPYSVVRGSPPMVRPLTVAVDVMLSCSRYVPSSRRSRHVLAEKYDESLGPANPFAVLAGGSLTTSLVARYRGEEFVAVLEGVASADAIRIAGDIRATFDRAIDIGTGTPIRVTVSAGCAELGEDRNTSAGLSQADVWLSQAKRSGRNQVRGL